MGGGCGGRTELFHFPGTSHAERRIARSGASLSGSDEKAFCDLKKTSRPLKVSDSHSM